MEKELLEKTIDLYFESLNDICKKNSFKKIRLHKVEEKNNIISKIVEIPLIFPFDNQLKLNNLPKLKKSIEFVKEFITNEYLFEVEEDEIYILGLNNIKLTYDKLVSRLKEVKGMSLKMFNEFHDEVYRKNFNHVILIKMEYIDGDFKIEASIQEKKYKKYLDVIYYEEINIGEVDIETIFEYCIDRTFEIF